MELIKVSKPCVGNEELTALKEVLYSGNYISGKKVERFEEDFSNYHETSYGIATNSCTSALHVALASVGIGPGDEVIVPALTFFSTVSSVIHQNAIPIFADIDIKSYNINPDDIIPKISEKTKAIIPVHFYGQPAKMDSIMSIADEFNLKVIEDCAQAHGAIYKNQKVGSFGDCGCFSFFATKNITTGEGGMVITNDVNLMKLAKKIRSHGMSDRDTHEILGYNYRMTEFAAAMGLAQLKKLDNFNELRRKNSFYLYENIQDIDWIIIPEVPSYVHHVFFWCPIQIDETKLGMKTQELRKLLMSKGVETRYRYNQPLNSQKLLIDKNAYPMNCPFSCPYYDKPIDYSRFKLPNANKIAGKMLGLPNHPLLKKTELEQIVNILHEI
jgi:perosamine synthetase